MKHTILTTIATLALATAGSVQAQNNQGLIKASTLEGKNVSDAQGNELGQIEQVLIDPQTGRARYAVLVVDKAWNWNDPKVAVPFQSFNIERKGDDDVTITLDATKERLEKAPKFKEGDADRIYNRAASQPVYSYWAITWFDDDQLQSGNSSPNRDPASTKKTMSGTNSAAADKKAQNP